MTYSVNTWTNVKATIFSQQQLIRLTTEVQSHSHIGDRPNDFFSRSDWRAVSNTLSAAVRIQTRFKANIDIRSCKGLNANKTACVNLIGFWVWNNIDAAVIDVPFDTWQTFGKQLASNTCNYTQLRRKVSISVTTIRFTNIKSFGSIEHIFNEMFPVFTEATLQLSTILEQMQVNTWLKSIDGGGSNAAIVETVWRQNYHLLPAWCSRDLIRLTEILYTGRDEGTYVMLLEAQIDGCLMERNIWFSRRATRSAPPALSRLHVGNTMQQVVCFLDCFWCYHRCR